MSSAVQLTNSLRRGNFDLPSKSELRSQRSLIQLDVFQSSQDSIYASPSLTSRVASTLTTPLWWALESLSLVDSTHVEPEATLWARIRGRHVVVALLEKAASVVVEKLTGRTTSSPADSLYDFSTFKKLFGGVGDVFEDVALSEVDLRVLVKFLARDQGIIVADRHVSHAQTCLMPLNYDVLMLLLSS